MLRESGRGQDVPEASSRVLSKKCMLLTARNTSSLVINSLCDQAGKDDIAVAGMYWDLLSQQKQTIANVMGVILRQLEGRGGIPDHVREAFQKGQREFSGRGPRLVDLMGMLKMAIVYYPRF